MSRFTIEICDNEGGETLAYEVDGYYLGLLTDKDGTPEYDDAYDNLDANDLDALIDQAIDTLHNEFDEDCIEDFES